MTTQSSTGNIHHTEDFLRVARSNLSRDSINEQQVRDTFTSYLPSMFPERPYWVRRHIDRAESSLVSERRGKPTNVFVDNLVDNTAIEYETNLRNQALYTHGHDQVREYCASLVRDGGDPNLIYGILSDTLEWHVYSILINPEIPRENILPDHVTLVEIESLNLHGPIENEGSKLLSFLSAYLGRIESRTLSAENIAHDLGFESPFYASKYNGLRQVVINAFDQHPEYAQIIRSLWGSFVAYLNPSNHEFDIETYIAEYYITTLAKIICANAIEGKALYSSADELKDILNGSFFSKRQIDNMVEHDYFGWLMKDPYISEIAEIASQLQKDLTAYKFSELPEERDIFGPLMAQLADRTRRILLGQEWTPSWLARQMAIKLIEMLPNGETPRFIDMCCGSGAMISQVLAEVKKGMNDDLRGNPDLAITNLSQAITGFDIDPVAVLLSKITWVLSVRDLLSETTLPISIPVYHADSLFLITPLERRIDTRSNAPYALDIDGQTLNLPNSLMQSQFQHLFDDLIELAYRLGMEASQRARKMRLSTPYIDIDPLITQLQARLEPIKLEVSEKTDIVQFIEQLIQRIAILDFTGRNGIWAFILRNSYRPSLVIGNFNGIISNPPWLAMSKIAENPYKEAINEIATHYGIKPTGSSFPHLDLSTVFIMHASDRYLSDNGVFACIVPLTVLNGHHHNPFRLRSGPRSDGSFVLTEIWEVEKGVFKNRAGVILGSKGHDLPRPELLPGLVIGPARSSPCNWNWLQMGNHSIWSNEPIHTISDGFFRPANFRQGADILPRRLFFVEATSLGNRRSNVHSIRRGTDWYFAVSDAKRPFQTFSLTGRCVVSDDFIFNTILSKHLAPFHLSGDRFVKTIAPIRKGSDGQWQVMNEAEIIIIDRNSNLVFDQIRSALISQKSTGGRNRLWEDYLNYRNKLSQQNLPDRGFLVLTGAGGEILCSTYVDIRTLDRNKLLIDQTLYWARVETEDEAIYLTGLFNSDAINRVIFDFVPQGQFGGRHQHTLPFGATPPYDPNEAAHQEVVESTRALLSEFRSRLHEINIWANRSRRSVVDVLDPSSNISWRRRIIREFIRQLSSYERYNAACNSLYGL